MKRLIRPDTFGSGVTAFFTGKDPGADLGEIARIVGIDEDHIFMPVQKHTDIVVVPDAGLVPMIADAVVTNRKGLLIGVLVADCVPLLLYDPVHRVIGAVHAGWRGTAAGIVKNTIRMFISRFNSNPREMVVAIGPGIKQCCYEVDPDVAHSVEKATGRGDDMQGDDIQGDDRRCDYVRKKGAKYHVDLPLANRYQALSEGVAAKNIWISRDCTFCNPEKYCSFRYSKGTTCRQGGFIGLL